MAEQDVFEFSAKFNVEVEKSSMNQACNVLDDFYKKYNNKKMKIDTKDMVSTAQKGIMQIQRLYHQGLREMEQNGIAWWQIEDIFSADGLDFLQVREKMQQELKDAMLVFSDGSIFSALDEDISDVLSDKFSQGITVAAVDLGRRVQHLKSQIAGILEELDVNRLDKYYDKSVDYSSGDMSKSEILDRIDLLKKLIEYQKELELFNSGEFSVKNAPTIQDTSTLVGNLEQLREYFDDLEALNLSTIEQLKRRKELIAEANEDWQWDNDQHDNAKENIKDDDIYENAIASLEEYIEQRKETIQKLKDNEDELFSVDGITKYINNANKQIERFQKQKLELQNLREGKTDIPNTTTIGDLTELLDALQRIEDAVKGITTAFKPLTDALASEDSALSAMVKANVADLELLNSKVEEAFSNIEKLSNKQFNVTNVLSSGNNAQNDIEQIRQFRQEAKEIYKQVEELYAESFETTKKIKGTPEGLTAFLDFSNIMSEFDMTDLGKRIKSRSATSLGIVIDELNEWKKVLLQFNSLRNNVEAGSFNVSKYNDTSAKVKIGSKTTDKDDNTIVEKNTIDNTDILDKVRSLSEQIKEEFASIRLKVEEMFDFSTVNPNLENIKSITEDIYQQFVDLQSKIGALEFKLQLPEVIDKNKSESNLIDDASDAMNNEGDAAQDAVPKKNAFTEANKKAAESGKATEDATKGAAEGIQAEANAVEQSAGAIVEASDKLDKVKYTTDADRKPYSKTTTSTTKRENAIETESQYYTYNKDGEVELQAITIVRDFKKRASELKREADKIALAQKTVDKFVSQFESKTAGQASKIKGFDGENGLKGFTIKSLDDIEIATQKMIELDAEYNKLTKSFRQGTKSMNPFVNAITGIGEMENKIQEIEIAFNGLNTKPEKLAKEVDNLIPLFGTMMSFISEDADGNKTITDIYGMAEAYGTLNAALRQVNSNIKIQKQIDASKTKDVNFGLDLEKQFSTMSKQQAQWEKNGQLTDELRQKINSMFDSLAEVTNSSELGSWKKQWSILKDEVMETKYQIEAAKKAQEPIDKKEAQDKAYWDGRFKDSVDDLITPEKRPELERIKASMLQQAEATEESVVEQYDTIMTIITNKNNALQKLMSAKGPEEQKYRQDQYSAWFGAWEALDKDVLSRFFEDAGNQAILGAEKIDKFNKAVEQAQSLAARNKDKKNKAEDDAKDKEQKDLGVDVSNAYKEYTKAIIELKKLQADPSGKDHTNEIQALIKDIQDAKKKLSELGIDVNKIAENTVLTEKQTNDLLEQRIAYKKELQRIDSKAADAEIDKSNKEADKKQKEAQKYGKTIYNRESKYRDIIDANIRSIEEENLSDDFLKQIEKYKTAYKEFENVRNKIANSSDVSDGLKNQFQDAALEVEKLRKEIIGVFKESQKFDTIPIGSIFGKKTFDASEIKDVRAALIEYAAEVTNGQLKITGFNASNTEMYGVLDKGAGVVQEVTVALQSGTNTLYAYESGTKQVSNSWQQLGDKLKSGVRSIISQYVGFHEAIQAFRQGFTYVKEIDLAMTELKKVTNETDATYRQFLQTASSVSSVIGSTVSDFTDATAAFARLGYSIDESTSMAQTAIVYKNVADGLDTVEESTQSIISTMAAFGISANDTMSIVDKFNAVGNNFSITSAGIGDALQRSASALYSAGNSIDESVALVTAANSVIQNPEQVGELIAQQHSNMLLVNSYIG